MPGSFLRSSITVATRKPSSRYIRKRDPFQSGPDFFFHFLVRYLARAPGTHPWCQPHNAMRNILAIMAVICVFDLHRPNCRRYFGCRRCRYILVPYRRFAAMRAGLP